MILGIDHVGIAVTSADAARTFETLLDAPATAPDTVSAQGVRVCFVPGDAPNLELLAPDDGPAAEAGAVRRFLERRGEGLHHVCFAVDDVTAELRRLTQAGFEAIDPTPREGHGGLVAFVHPRGTHGVLIELLQRRP